MDVSYDRFYRDCEELAEKIRSSNKDYDHFLCILRGGGMVGNQLAHILDFRNISSVTITHHEEGGNMGEASELFPAIGPGSGEKVLLIDDLRKSGATIDLVYRNYGDMFDFDVAVLYDKGRGNRRLDFYITRVPRSEWITLPWEKPRNLDYG